MASVTVGPCGSSPQVWWDISWTPGNTTWTVTARRGSDGVFYGGGWTASLTFDNVTIWSTYVPAPTNSNTASSSTITVSPLPSYPSTIYFRATSTNFSSSGLFEGSTGVLYQPPVYYTVTVEDRVGNSSGALLGSGSYSVLSGTNISANSLRTTTYSGYNYSSCTSATITKNTTLYRYFTATGWHVSDTGSYSSISADVLRSITLDKYGVSRVAVTFALSGTATFYSESNLDTYGYLSTSSDFDSANGAPSSPIASNDDSGGNTQYQINYPVQANTTYYLWTRFYSNSSSGSVTIHISPPCWKLTDTYSISNLNSKYTRNVSFSSYSMSRIAIIFGNSGKAKFYTEGDIDTIGFLSISPELDTINGRPINSIVSNDDSDGSNQYSIEYEVEAGKTYYLWTRFWAYGSEGNTSIVIIPPGGSGVRICVQKDGALSYEQYMVWIYKGDGGGPNNNGWHRATPMIYCDVDGNLKFHACG